MSIMSHVEDNQWYIMTSEFPSSTREISWEYYELVAKYLVYVIVPISFQ